MRVITAMIANGLIRQSSSGKYYSACHMDEEITMTVNNIVIALDEQG